MSDNNEKTLEFQNLPKDVQAAIEKVNPEGTDLYEVEYKTNMNRGIIPNYNDPAIQASFNKNRATATYTGGVQRGKQMERIELKKLLLNDSIKSLLTSKGANVDDIEVIDYIPNSRFAYFNKLIKMGLRYGLSPCDIDVVRTTWMSDQQRKSLTRLLSAFLNKDKPGFTLIPSNRTGVKYKCQDNKAMLDLYNPGVVDLSDNFYKQSCSCPPDKTANEISDIYGHISNIVNKYVQEVSFSNDDEVIRDHFDPHVAKLIHWSRDMALTGTADFNKLKHLMRAFDNYKSVINSSYILSLANPFKYNQEVRVPSTMPMPTASFSVQRNINLVTNATGNCSFVIAPFYLTAASNSVCAINNNATLDGVNISNFYASTDLGQSMATAFYARYRLVSAGVKLTFTSSSLTSTGFATMSVDFESPAPLAHGSVIGSYQKYSIYSNVENGFFKQTSAITSGQTLDINFLPVDGTFQEFYSLGNFPSGFVISGYLTGAPASTTVARLDIVFNYEALVAQGFTDYIPSSTNNNNSNVELAKTFINNCSATRSADSSSMMKYIPNTEKDEQGSKSVLPIEPIKIVNPLSKNSFVDSIKNVGNELISTIVDTKLSDKNLTDKLNILDKIKYKMPSLEKFNPLALGSAITGAGATTSLLGNVLNIGSKILPFL